MWFPSLNAHPVGSDRPGVCGAPAQTPTAGRRRLYAREGRGLCEGKRPLGMIVKPVWVGASPQKISAPGPRGSHCCGLTTREGEQELLAANQPGSFEDVLAQMREMRWENATKEEGLCLQTARLLPWGPRALQGAQTRAGH